MKKGLTAALLIAGGLVAGCSTTSSNNTNARGANTNTGYFTNSETNAKPTINSNVTNVEPPSLTNSNGSANHSSSNTNANSNSNKNSNTKRP